MSGVCSATPLDATQTNAAAPPLTLVIQITRDKPCYYLTSVAHDRLPIFRSDVIKQIVCNAWSEARRSGEILIFAYVIMPDHSHIISDGHREIADVLRFTNGISAKRILDYLKENEFESSLKKLRQAEKRRGYKHSIWQHHPDAFRITGEDTFMQKVNYIHQNPVRAGLVERAEDYRFSSARLWNGDPLDVEPFLTDHKLIKWRQAAA
jgi:REP element-mobilizing transposase RayT